MPKTAIVLGAGVVGVSTAWWLRQAGFDVEVVERREGPALETSFANGGQISVSHSEPWASPGAPLKILSWLGREDSPLLWRPSLDPAQWAWCLRFLLECLPSRNAANTAAVANLGLRSRANLVELRRSLGLQYDHAGTGIMHLFFDAKAFEASRASSEIMRAHGCDRRELTPEQALAVEPAIAPFAHRLAGASWTAEDESGDARGFTLALAERAAAAGVRFRHRTEALRIDCSMGRFNSVAARSLDPADAGRETSLRADLCVVCLGPRAQALLTPLRVATGIWPAKGYSATFPILDRAKAPSLSLTDEGRKIVLTPLGDRLRVAGTAEIAGWDLSLNPVRCQALASRAAELLPGAADYANPTYWAGLRPSRPDNAPLVGKTPFEGLLLNVGHGTLGWTLACGCAEAVADIASGRAPQVDYPFADPGDAAPFAFA